MKGYRRIIALFLTLTLTLTFSSSLVFAHQEDTIHTDSINSQHQLYKMKEEILENISGQLKQQSAKFS